VDAHSAFLGTTRSQQTLLTQVSHCLQSLGNLDSREGPLAPEFRPS
jgi:hypothetical protein